MKINCWKLNDDKSKLETWFKEIKRGKSLVEEKLQNSRAPLSELNEAKENYKFLCQRIAHWVGKVKEASTYIF